MEALSSVREMADLAAKQATEAARREMERQRQRTHMGWFLTNPLGGQSDKRAIEALKLRRFETYYPMIREKHLVPKRQMTRRQRACGVEIIAVRDRPYLPRYVFVRMDPRAGDWEIITAECGITGLVCKEQKPVLFSDHLILAMQAREVGGAIPGTMPALTVFEVGEAVKVISGPFATFPGIVEKLRTKTIADIDIITGLRVAIDIFGRPTPVELECDQVAKIESGDHG